MTRPDPDMIQYGLEPPFLPWEHDHTALVHVLWSADFQGLSLEKDADEIASMILGSRWMQAREHHAKENRS